MVKMSRAKRRDEGCCSVDFLKNVLHIYNILFLISGLLVLGTAIWTMLDKYKYVVLLTTDIYPTMIYSLLVAGGLVVLVTIVGVCAVTKEHRPLLLIYIFSLLLIFLLEAMVGILAFVYQDLVHNELEMMKLNVTIAEVYGVDDTKTQAIDFLQDEFNCCGAEDFEDWTLSSWRSISNGNLVPDSCCKTYTPKCGKRTHPSNIHYMGCLDRMEDHLKGHLTILSSVGLGICVLQIFGIIYACMLYCKLLDVDDIKI